MFWKTVLITFFAVGVLAQYQINDDQRHAMRNMVRDHCKKYGGEDKVDNIENAVKTFVDCLKGLFDMEQIVKEIEEAKPHGALDEVFKKYCQKSPQLKTCIHSLFEGVSPCLDQNSRSQIGTVNNATDQLIDFVCYKDGDRIALFIAESGPECFQEKAQALRECGNKIKDSVGTLEAVQALTTEAKCAKYDEFSVCIVKALEECPTPTPGNMAESLLRYVRNSMPCQKQ